MKVKEVMTPDAKTIWITESLADAAKEMWENDCGILPIIKDGRKVIGMITDRDICMATAIRDRNPSSISVEEVMNATVYAVEADEEVEGRLVGIGDGGVGGQLAAPVAGDTKGQAR